MLIFYTASSSPAISDTGLVCGTTLLHLKMCSLKGRT